jgi:hypothetical protein
MKPYNCLRRLPRRISRIIRELVREWGKSPYDINDGPCEEFALEVMDQSGLPYGPPAWEIYEDSTDGVALPGHVWIAHGGRSYDAEAPDGVDDWRDLPLFRRIRGLPGFKRTLDLNCKSDADLDAIGEGEGSDDECPRCGGPKPSVTRHRAWTAGRNPDGRPTVRPFGLAPRLATRSSCWGYS